MVPPAEALPLVLPTDRLNARGMAVPAVRQQFRRIHDVRNTANVVSVWLQSFGLDRPGVLADAPAAPRRWRSRCGS